MASEWDVLEQLEEFAAQIDCTNPGVVKLAAEEISRLREHAAALADERDAGRIGNCRWVAWHAARFGRPFPPAHDRPPRALQLAAARAAYGDTVARELYPVHQCTAEEPWTPEIDTEANHSFVQQGDTVACEHCGARKDT